MYKIFAVILLFLVATALCAGFYYYQNLKPVDTSNQTTKIFVVKKGQSITSIGQSLYDNHLIRSPQIFKLFIALNKKNTNIQAGSFRLSPNLTTPEIIDKLSHGTLDLWVTLKEGWRKEEFADEISRVYSEQRVTFNAQEFLRLTKDKEGYLYPDTYLLPINADAATIVSILENTFEKKVTSQIESDLVKQGKTLKEAVILASLLEREGKTLEDKRMIADILLKRLDAGWPLQIDATLQYAYGFDKNTQTWWRPPVAIDKQIKSPYNTYANLGLPPTPICSVSQTSLIAATSPTINEYWFYLTGNDGVMRYATSLEGHNQNIQKYLR